MRMVRLVWFGLFVMVGFAALDAVWLVLFVMAYLRTPKG